MTKTVTISGGCHCKAVRFTATVPKAAKLTHCNCSICKATGFVHLFVPHGDVVFAEGSWEALTSYQFASKTANHLFCKVCGIKSFYQPRSHPNDWSINVTCLDDASLLNIAEDIHFDGQNWEDNIDALRAET